RARPAGSGLLAVGPAHVAVVAVLVAVGLAATTWWVVRDQAEPVSAVSAEPVGPLVGAPTPAGASSSAAEPAASSGASPASVTVDVAGKVRRPGIVVLDQGARVADALRAAGGARRGVDLTSVNLARVLVDGEQIVVGAPPGAQPVAPGAPPASGGGAPAPGGPLVNLNTASQAELETLPGVGPVTARSILAWREQHGGFSSVDELLEVDGIGDKTLATLTPHVTV
ncbi:helix-hairpin-helix domain-containing protein, partial [Nocardioides sp. SYSU DS0651]|uniref:helix-hairpin-helix domain-containing protein n=1 Tax=Nocardioides sp. SYSU DS0651 TaxID=3415955 RepID=UPI003F4C148E